MITAQNNREQRSTPYAPTAVKIHQRSTSNSNMRNSIAASLWKLCRYHHPEKTGEGLLRNLQPTTCQRRTNSVDAPITQAQLEITSVRSLHLYRYLDRKRRRSNRQANTTAASTRIVRVSPAKKPAGPPPISVSGGRRGFNRSRMSVQWEHLPTDWLPNSEDHWHPK
jgi:hypothetical protein